MFFFLLTAGGNVNEGGTTFSVPLQENRRPNCQMTVTFQPPTERTASWRKRHTSTLFNQWTVTWCQLHTLCYPSHITGPINSKTTRYASCASSTQAIGNVRIFLATKHKIKLPLGSSRCNRVTWNAQNSSLVSNHSQIKRTDELRYQQPKPPHTKQPLTTSQLTKSSAEDCSCLRNESNSDSLTVQPVA